MTPIEEVKSRLDIVDVIAGYLTLKRAGSNWKANCPFHSEKTPSFMVSKDKQIWHCFGCNEGGDVITFVQKYEGLDFVEALKMLADKAGVRLPDYRPTEDSGLRARLFEANQAAATFWQANLKANNVAAQKTKAYLEKRGLTSKSVQDWGLGLAADSWDELYKFLKTKEFSDEEIWQAGLSLKKDNKYFDVSVSA